MSEPSPMDPRLRRTRRRLHEAVLDLAANRDFGAITARDITTRAEVNRTTFYLHYLDKDDLVGQALDALFDEFTAGDRTFVDAHGRVSPATIPPPLIDLFRHAGGRPELYRRLLGGNGSSAFAARLRAFHERQFLRVWHDMRLAATDRSPLAELRARFAAAATQGVIDWWLECGEGETADAMAAWLWQLVAPLWFEAASSSPVSHPSSGAEFSALTP